MLLSTSGAHVGAPILDVEVGKAEALLKHSDDLLLASQSLRATYTDTATYSTPYRDLRQTGTVTLSKPGLARVEITRARRVTSSEPWVDTGNNTLRVVDGTEQFSVFFHPYSTQVRSTKKLPPAAINEAPLLNGFFGSKNSPWRTYETAKEKGDLKDVQVSGSEITFVAGSVKRVLDLDASGLVVTESEQAIGSPDSRSWHLEKVQIGDTVSRDTFSYRPPAGSLPYERQERLDSIETGADAPEIAVTDVHGKDLHLSSLRGKVVLLKFWATWCWPCNQSMPETEALGAKYGNQGLQTLAVAIKDSRKGFLEWVAKHKKYSHIQFAFDDPGQSLSAKAFQVSTTPTVYVIGRDGKVAAEFEGFTGTNAALEEAVRQALEH